MSKPILYHVPPSFYSQIVRLALAEKGVDYDSRYVIPGPPAFESYAPQYMRLNPQGTVPALVHDDLVLSDSRAILEYLEVRFPGWGLELQTPAGNGGETDRWIEALYAIPVRELSYGSDKLRRIGAFVNAKRVKNLRQRLSENPGLAEVYAEKIADIEGFAARAQDPHHMCDVRNAVSNVLDELDDALGGRRFVAGPDYSMADVVWTVGIARLTMLGIEPLKDRAALAEWYARMKERPGFRVAYVMERFKPSAILRVLWSKFRARLPWTRARALNAREAV